MNRLLVGNELKEQMTYLPPYDESIREQDKATRLLSLDNLYQIYIATDMSEMVYTKLYLAVNMAMKKKMTSKYIEQQNSNYQTRRYGSSFNGIIGGGDSFAIIGKSGIGKTSAINRSIQLISEENIEKIVTDFDERYMIAVLRTQNSYSCSAKGMLLEIISQIDKTLGTSYMKSATRAGVNTDQLLSSVCTLCCNHIGVLVVEEVQHLRGHKSGETLINMLTQLVNSSGITIVFVGTEEAVTFFEKKMQLARRTIPIHCRPFEYGNEFETICRTILQYIYTKDCMEINSQLIYWLYEHSAGTIAVLISLIHDAQQEAIMTNDIFDYKALNTAFARMETLHKHIEFANTKKVCMSRVERKYRGGASIDSDFSVTELVEIARGKNMDIITLLLQKEILEVIEL